MIWRSLACGAASLFLWACADGRSAGNSVETESDVAARVLPVDSILPDWNADPSRTTVVTLRLDRWNFDFSRSTADGRDLRIERLDSTPVPFTIDQWDSTARIGRLLVRLDSVLLGPGAVIRLRWGDTARPAADDSARTWQGISDSTRLGLTSVLVDDFEARSDTTLLPTRPLWRRAASDSAIIYGLDHDSAARGRKGSAVHLRYRASGIWYALVQTALVRGGAPRSLRPLDSLVFWARGNGKVWITFDHLTDGYGPKAWVSKSLDSNWTRIRIRPQDLDSASEYGNNQGWETIRDSVTHLTFIAVTGTDLWFDDVRLHGVDRDDVR